MNAPNELELFNEQSIIQKLKAKLARQQSAIAETQQHIAAIEALRKTREEKANAISVTPSVVTNAPKHK